MNDYLLLMMLQRAVGPGDARLMISIGWISPEWRRLTRETTEFYDQWRHVCVMLLPLDISSESIHRRDLGLTPRSRCFNADKHGYIKGSSRCSNKAHYYSDSLEPSVPTNCDYVSLTLTKVAQAYIKRTKKATDLASRWQQHRALCQQLAERPWLAPMVETLLSKDESLLPQTVISQKRKYFALQQSHS